LRGDAPERLFDDGGGRRRTLCDSTCNVERRGVGGVEHAHALNTGAGSAPVVWVEDVATGKVARTLNQPAGGEQVPGGVGLTPVVPAGMVAMRLALRPSKHKGRPVEVRLSTEV